ncbi:hypothetical protein chiPu_0012655 [Chiloscyllium punctatum]|uniref:Uncharacterized protein n=1 Tax=Chiloscyllium punctatum TaxID=137246 RepID=A0A401SUW7_CHIPU|nr:hypothetical protein [Chiloscyllium punctatum]
MRQKSEDEILHGSFRFEGDSVAAKMYKLSKLKVMENIWNLNINRRLGEEDTIREDSEDEMGEFSGTNYANWRGAVNALSGCEERWAAQEVKRFISDSDPTWI